MGFIGDIFSALVEVVVAVVDIVVQIVEVILEFIMSLLGFSSGQTIEYFEVRNIPLFEDADDGNPLLNVIRRSILTNTDLASDLIYASAFRTLKGNMRTFMQFIENGNYFESFPNIDSYITYIEVIEVADALGTLEGEACTPENTYLRALTEADWVKYWMQENKSYNVGTNEFVATDVPLVTDPATTSSSFSNNTTVSTDIQLAIDDEIATSDSVVGMEQTWEIDLGNITYNEGDDDYTLSVYNSLNEYAVPPYDVPSRPTQLHYVCFYTVDSNPTVTKLFIYRVGEGTYPNLDNPENAINIANETLRVTPAIPLRIDNQNYDAAFSATKAEQIEELCKLISVDAEAVIDSIMNDPDAVPGNIDHVYINFGVRMWDTTQVGMQYLYTFFENLFPAQGITQGDYDGTPSGDTKPVNNVIVTAGDYKYLFQFNYITYDYFTLAEIDADSGSIENGIYYSDMSRFNSDGDLVYPYYISSGKGTYNVGYKASTLDEVQDFLDGVGVVNPGTTTGEATNWMQVTERMSYNNPSPVLLDADGGTSDLIFLTPDLIYKNNGSGVLQHVNSASEETTSGQSITYYRASPSGLDAYTVAAPIASLRVEDAESSVFKMVKFGLGARDDLMVPFMYEFVEDLSNEKVTRLFLASAHISIYLARYEVIKQSGFGFLFMIILIIIIIVVIVVTAGAATPAAFGAGALSGSATVAGGTTAAGAYTGAVTVSTAGVVTTSAATATVPAGTVVTAGLVSSAAPITGIVSQATISAITASAALTGSAAAAFTVAWAPTLLGWAAQFAVSQIVQRAVTAVVGDSPFGQILGAAAGAFAGSITSVQPGTYNISFDLSKIDWLGFAGRLAKDAFFAGIDILNNYINVYVKDELDELNEELEDYLRLKDTDPLRELYESLFVDPDSLAFQLVGSYSRGVVNPMLPEDYLVVSQDVISRDLLMYDIESSIEFQIENPTFT